MINLRCVVLTVPFWVSLASAQITETKLTASDPEPLDSFGNPVAVSENHALIGGGDGIYHFYFEGSSWIEQGKILVNGGTQARGAFSLSGDNAIVVHYGDTTHSAYVLRYDGSGWVEQAKLDGAVSGGFGAAVSISGEYAIVSAIGIGSAYVFHNDGSGWVEEATLRASDGQSGDSFGNMVSINGEYALVAAYNDNNENGIDAGAVYVFYNNGSTWSEHSKLIPQNGAAHDWFGTSISFSGERVVVGAPGDGLNAGAAYVFHNDGSTWVEEAKLVASNRTHIDYFGESISISGDYVIAGAYGDGDDLTELIDWFGAAYIFHFDGSNWVEQVKLVASDRSSGDYFGISVSLDNDLALVGAYRDDDGGVDAGSAYIYTGFSSSSAADPIAYYPFNGNADDESGNENHGTVVGATITADRFGNANSAYSFDGVDDYIGIPPLFSSTTTEATMALWFRTSTTATDQNLIYHGDEGEIQMGLVNGEILAVEVKLSNGLWYRPPGNVFAQPNNWHFLVGVWDKGDFLKVYLDGVSRDSIAVPDLNMVYSGAPSAIGATYRSIYFCAGLIDDVRIYDRALTADEIQELYGDFAGEPLAPYGVTYGSTGSANANNPGALITIDPLTGGATVIGPTGIPGDNGSSVPALAIKSTGEIYGVSSSNNSGLYTIDASTGAGTFVASTGLSLPNAMGFDGTDVLYVTDGSGNVYTLDETTGAASLIGALGINVRGIAFDPTDGTMYGSSGTDGIYTIDPTTAVATFIGNTGLGGSTPDIQFDLNGNLFGTKIGGGTIYNYVSINKQTGAGTVIGSTGMTAIIGLSARQVRSDIVPVTMEIEIDPEDQIVPPGGATFPYSMTFTNNTAQTQTVDYWTKLVRPTGSTFDPFDGPTTLTLAAFGSATIDTNQVAVPANAVPGFYHLIGYVGDYQTDTMDVDSTNFTKLDDSIPCGDIAQFKARCRPGGLVQAKAIFTDFTHVGETVKISVDQFPYEVTVGINGQATFSQTGFNPGVHTVELTDPKGCFPAIQVTCGAGVGLELEEDWHDTWETPTATALLGNYPNPFNPSTTFRYALSSPELVTLKVYNMLGQLVRTIVDDNQVEGHYEAVWDGRNETGATVSSGIYIYRMTAGSFIETLKMLLIK